MEITELPIKGAYIVRFPLMEDPRGSFQRVYSEREFIEIGVLKPIVQINMSHTSRRGTIRGLHYQAGASAEIKMVRCLRGEIFDVIVDLRPDSGTYLKWHGQVLSAETRQMIIVPEGLAHGFQALSDNVEVIYPVTAPYAPEDERGIRWDDPAFNIKWPIDKAIVSDKDAGLPDFKL